MPPYLSRMVLKVSNSKPKMKKTIIWIVIALLLMTRIDSSLAVNENGHENMDVDNQHYDPVSDDVRAMGGPENLENILNDKFIIINGVRTTLGALFGDKRPTASSLRVGEKIKRAFLSNVHYHHMERTMGTFWLNHHQDVIISQKPRRVEENCASCIYTRRKFLDSSLTEENTWLAPLADTPSVIASALVNDLSTTPRIIVGNARSGRTMALAMIQTTLSEIMPTIWTILIDLEKDRYPRLNFDGVIRQAVGPDFSDLILNVMETNPRQIVLLIDGTDHVTVRQAEGIVVNVRDAAVRGVRTVITGRKNILNVFKTVFSTENVPQHLTIGEMTFQETEKFLTNAWQPAVNHELSLRSSTSSHFDGNEVPKRLTYFAQALTHTLFKTSLPRQPVTLQILANSFESKETMRNAEPEPRQLHSMPFIARADVSNDETFGYPVTCLDYVFNPSTKSPSLVAALENIVLNVDIMYEKIISVLYESRSLKLKNAEYSILAVTAINKREQSANRALLPLPQDFHKSLTEALRALKTQHSTDPLIDINGDQIEFCYPGIENYYAAKYITDEVHRIVYLSQRMLKHVFENNNINILEFLNTQLISLSPEVPSYFNEETSLNILKNMIKHGYDNLFLYVYDHLNADIKNRVDYTNSLRRKLQHDKELSSNKILGMTQVSVEHPNPYAETAQSQVPLTHLQLIIKHNMQKSLKEILHLFKDQTELIGISIKNHLLDAAVTKPVPNLQMVKDLMDFVPLKALAVDLDRLLYETVDKVGDGCQQVANYLVQQGARPRNAVVEGSTLVHAAVQSNSANLLRFVVKDLLNVQGNIEDSRDDSGRSIFETALDANASPMYTFPGWWEMMDYLVGHLNPLRLPTTTSVNLNSITISREHIKSAEFQLMLMNAKHQELNIQTENILVESLSGVKPLEMHGYSDEQMGQWTRFIPYTRWSFSRDLLSVRRLSWLRIFNPKIPDASPLEMLIIFRGAMPLQLTQHIYYHNAVLILIERYRFSLALEENKERLYRLIWENVADGKDLLDTLDHTIIVGSGPSLPTLHDIIKNQIQIWSDIASRHASASISSVSVLGRLAQTRLDYAQGHTIEKMNKIVNQYKRHLEQMNQRENQGFSNPFQCLRRRFRRSQAGCSDFANEVSKFINKKQTRKSACPTCSPMAQEIYQVNSDRFLEVLAEAEQSYKIHAYKLVRLLRKMQQKIQINSERFLQVLAETRKSDELVKLVRALALKYNYEGLITGSSRMLVKDVLEHGGLSAYRQSRRIADSMGELWHSSARSRKFMALMPSRTTALYIGSHVPLVHALFAAIDACLQHRVDPSDKRCWYGAGMFGLSVLLGPVGNAAVRYTPWMVDQFSRVALELLPSKAPAFLRENIYIVRNIGLKYGARTLAAGLAILGVGFDIYNIVTMSQAIAECNREPDLCTSRDKGEYIISLTFSSVSIVVTGGLMISGVGIIPAMVISLQLIMVERLALGVNDAVYYAKKYHTTFGETFRIFWRKFLGISQPSDITALVERKQLIEHLRYQVKQFMNETANKSIIAYGIVIGSLVTGGNIIASYGVVDMSKEDIKHSKTLSRMLPEEDSDLIGLCLPHEDSTKGYSDYSNSVPTAKYRCVNSFVLAHRKRWESGVTEKSYIIYDLRYIEDGLIIGSNSINNLFLIYNGTTKLSVKGGRNINNNYIIHENSFRGSVELHDRSLQNILNLASMTSLQTVLRFEWNAKSYSGHVCFENTSNSCFQLNTSINATSTLHVIGRTEQEENYNCDYTNQANKTDVEKHFISIDGQGGRSLSHMDEIIDCKDSVVHPFTRIIGSNSTNVSHTAHVYLQHVKTSRKKNVNTANAVIKLRKSKFTVFFENQSVFANIKNLTYNLTSHTLSWNIKYSRKYSLVLDVRRYAVSKRREINCLFIDRFSGALIFPIVRPFSKNNTGKSDTIRIRRFHISLQVNTSRLKDVISHNRNLTTVRGNRFRVVTIFTHAPTGKTFVFGSNRTDHLYINANTTFLQGGNGSDAYVLGQKAPQYVKIDNVAADRTLDTLVIPNNTCSSLTVKPKNRNKSHANRSEPHDITLFCGNISEASSGVNIVLRKYLTQPEYRHLIIIWDSAAYVLLPLHWTQGDDSASATERDVKLGLIYSFDVHLNALTLTSQNTRYLVLNMTENYTLLAYRLSFDNVVTNDVVITYEESASVVILENFFSTVDNATKVSEDWLRLKIFVTTDIGKMMDNVASRILTVDGLLHLIFSNMSTHGANTLMNESPIKEYHMTLASKTTVIKHNSTTQSGKHKRPGVLVVTGTDPEDFYAEQSTNDSNSLSLCTRESCTVVRNWCLSPRHRLYRLEFFSAVDQRPTVIRDLDELDCQPNSLEKLNGKLQEAQRELNLTLKHDESDQARLIRCVASVLVTAPPFHVIYKFLEFPSVIDHVSFIHSNCPSLFTKTHLKQLSVKAVLRSLAIAAKKYKLSSFNSQEQNKSILELEKFLARVNNRCWINFTTALNQLYKNNQIDILPRLNTITTFDKFNQISSNLIKCVGN